MRAISVSLGLMTVMVLTSAIVVWSVNHPIPSPHVAAPHSAAAIKKRVTPVPIVKPEPAPQMSHADQAMHAIVSSREAYQLAQIGLECEPVLGLYTKLGLKDPQRFEACAKYLTEPLPDWRYWQAKALEGRDLLARLHIEQEAWLTTHDKEHWRELNETMKEARRSGDAEVLFMLAQAWLNPEIGGRDPTAGLALLIEACGTLGCSLDDPRFGKGCVDTGACASGMTLLDQMEQAYGAKAMQAAVALNEEKQN